MDYFFANRTVNYIGLSEFVLIYSREVLFNECFLFLFTE